MVSQPLNPLPDYPGSKGGGGVAFPEYSPLHDTRFVGDGFRDRQRIKRKRERWVKRFTTMAAAERQVIAEALALADRSSSEVAQ